MLIAGPQALRVQDLPVCFPTRPCADFPPEVADVINFTTALTPLSPAIALGCFVLLGVALGLVVFELWPRRTPQSHLSLGVIALSATLPVLGLGISGALSARFNAISAIYGLRGSAGPDFYGSWWLVDLAGEAMAAAGLMALVIVAVIAVLRLKSATNL